MNPTRPSALVTGASSGIGMAIAELFARDGIDLVVAARSKDRLEAAAADWREKYGIEVTVIGCDLSQPGAAHALADEISKRGIAIDYLVNNAGFGSLGPFLESDLDQDEAMMRLNMESLTILTRRLLPGIVARKGKLLNVASTAAFQPGPYMEVYYATKAYVLSFTEALATELEGSDVTVTALCPGPTASAFLDRASMTDTVLIKGRRLPSAEEVARAGYRAMQRGRRVYIHGLMNRLLALGVRFAPRGVVTSVVRYLSRQA